MVRVNAAARSSVHLKQKTEIYIYIERERGLIIFIIYRERAESPGYSNHYRIAIARDFCVYCACAISLQIAVTQGNRTNQSNSKYEEPNGIQLFPIISDSLGFFLSNIPIVLFSFFLYSVCKNLHVLGERRHLVSQRGG